MITSYRAFITNVDGNEIHIPLYNIDPASPIFNYESQEDFEADAGFSYNVSLPTTLSAVTQMGNFLAEKINELSAFDELVPNVIFVPTQDGVDSINSKYSDEIPIDQLVSDELFQYFGYEMPSNFLQKLEERFGQFMDRYDGRDYGLDPSYVFSSDGSKLAYITGTLVDDNSQYDYKGGISFTIDGGGITINMAISKMNDKVITYVNEESGGGEIIK